MSQRRSLLIAVAAVYFAAGCEQAAMPSPADSREQEMVFVAGAMFRMGTDESELEFIAENMGLGSVRPLLSEVPSHDAVVADFFIDRFTVTNQDFQEFVTAEPTGSKENLGAEFHNGRYLEHWNNGEPDDDVLNHPVTFITWHSAVAFCAWQDKRLPTETEFEWAAQNATAPTEFPWGDDMPRDDLVNWGSDGIDTTVAVGSYPPNSRGLYDMSGNVWQFLSDPWLGSYQQVLDGSADVVGAIGDPDIRRVVRGGSFGASAANLRVRYRDSHRPYEAREMVGFRCARSAD